MIFKIYKQTVKPDTYHETVEIFSEFLKIYRTYGVTIVGRWDVEQDPSTSYIIAGYKDKDHYTSFITSMKKHETYQELTQRIASLRLSIETTDIILNEASPTNPEVSDIQRYLDEIKKIHSISVNK